MSGVIDVQQAWHDRWSDKPTVRPTCHNRPAFTGTVASVEFPGLAYDYRMTADCGHWKPGGNAHVRQWCDSAGGLKTPWSACNGCKWMKTDENG